MRRKWDFLAFVQILALGTISLLIIFSINRNLAANQLVYWVLGLSIFYTISQLDFRIWESYTPPIYVASIVLLILLLIFADPVRGSIRWIDLGFFRVQPSEIAKVGTIFLLASYFREKTAKNIKNVVNSFLLVLPVFFLVFLEPDIGSSLTFLAIWLGITIVAGFRMKHLAIFALISFIIIFLTYELLAPYQKQRLSTFVNPQQDPLGTGYNIIQSKIAIGSGTFFGKGFGQGTQSQLNFLPEAESDFIFASIAEQLGFIGAGLAIVLFAWMLARISFFAAERERYAQLVIGGIVTLLASQFVINVGMNLALMPVTGITFPLVSYGGSSLLVTLFLLGLTFSINRSWK